MSLPFGIWEPVCLLPLIITDDAGLRCCRDIFKHELWATSALPAPEEPETSIQRPKVCYWHHNIVSGTKEPYLDSPGCFEAATLAFFAA